MAAADAPPWRGFRLFFVLAAAQASIWPLVWLPRWAGLLPVPGHLAGAAWHGHEMIFGYVAAAMAGFLTLGTGGPAIWLLAGLWLAARLALLADAAPLLAAALDLAFLPLLLLLRRPPLWSGGKGMSLGILAVALGLTAVNAWTHAAALAQGDPTRPLATAAGFVALLLVLVGGRLIPGHTRATLRRGVGLQLTAAEAASMAAGIALVGALAAGWPIAVGIAAAALGLLQLYRLLRWWDPAVAREPLLWSLHAGFGWLAAGLLLLAASELGAGIARADALHAILVGAVGSLTLGIMTRLSLTHTGRPLAAGPLSRVAFALVSLAALARIAGPPLGLATPALTLATLAWTAAFLAFLLDHAPGLLSPARRRG
mgnify:CR=1 FL=1